MSSIRKQIIEELKLIQKEKPENKATSAVGLPIEKKGDGKEKIELPLAEESANKLSDIARVFSVNSLIEALKIPEMKAWFEEINFLTNNIIKDRDLAKDEVELFLLKENSHTAKKLKLVFDNIVNTICLDFLDPLTGLISRDLHLALGIKSINKEKTYALIHSMVVAIIQRILVGIESKEEDFIYFKQIPVTSFFKPPLTSSYLNSIVDAASKTEFQTALVRLYTKLAQIKSALEKNQHLGNIEIFINFIDLYLNGALNGNQLIDKFEQISEDKEAGKIIKDTKSEILTAFNSYKGLLFYQKQRSGAYVRDAECKKAACKRI